MRIRLTVITRSILFLLAFFYAVIQLIIDELSPENDSTNLLRKLIQVEIMKQDEEMTTLKPTKVKNKSFTKEKRHVNSGERGIFLPHETGSKANCDFPQIVERHTIDDHPDSGVLTACCERIPYRAPSSSFENTGDIIVGVLSSSSGSGPSKRESIRSTWANSTKGVFFIVAGPWNEISEEYERQKDLIWIEKEEVYDGLTLKTYSFLNIVHHLSSKMNNQYSYAFKTDDDSYIDLNGLQIRLRDESPDYWGWCPYRIEKRTPLRDPKNKYSISYEQYPEPTFPRYCQGAGFALSRRFIECAVSDNHIARARYIHFEDVAVGILAERCEMLPLFDKKYIRLYRTNTQDEKDRIKKNGKIDDYSNLPAANMTDRIVQHRIYNGLDMKDHHNILTSTKIKK